MRHPKLFLVIVLALLGTAQIVSAETGYVSDQLVLTLRSATGNKYQALGHIKTATAIEILGEEGKFLRVRTKDGSEGFVLKQYVTKTLPKKLIITRQNKELKELRKKLQQTQSSSSQQQQSVSELQQQREQLQQELEQSRQSLQQLTEEHQQLLDASQNLLQISEERDRLQQQNKTLAAEAARLEDENTTLLTTGSIKWFLAGAGVLCFGWVMGKVSRKRQRPF